jgi:hypothetical protein
MASTQRQIATTQATVRKLTRDLNRHLKKLNSLLARAAR